ncbi:MAG: hypothetical protein ACXWEI_23505, partial [Mycobacterium sp.]
RSRTILVAAVAIMLAAIAAAPVAAADPGDVTITTAGPHGTRLLGDVAAADNIAVAWQQGSYSFMRWSTDGGATFEPQSALRNGLRAKSPSLAACGDNIWAVSDWLTTDGVKVGIDYRGVGAAESGRFSLALGKGADIACLGDTIAVTWSYYDRVMLAIADGRCSNPCTPAFIADIGAGGGYYAGPTIAAFDTGVAVTWLGSGLTVGTFLVDRVGDAISVTPSFVNTVPIGDDVYAPLVGADGQRIVVTYGRFGQTHMRISDNRGQTLGPRIIVSNFCRDCPEAGSSPEAIDVRGGNILIEVGSAAGLCPRGCGTTEGFFTRNEGKRWKHTPNHNWSTQIGVFFEDRIAEAWDTHEHDFGNVQQGVWFHTLPLP